MLDLNGTVSPSDLLGAGSLKRWYPGQFDLMLKSLEWFYSPARFLGISASTGSGKSISALLLARLSGARTVVLTATKGLQLQYMTDAAELGGVLAKGQNNFRCLANREVTAEEGICHVGIPCDRELREQCPYRVQLDKARKSWLVITNYAYWLAQTNYSDGLGEVDLLIADEAHQAFGAMEGFLTVFLSRADIQPMGIMFPSTGLDQWHAWRIWAEASLSVAGSQVAELESEVRSRRSRGEPVPSAEIRAARHYSSVLMKLKRLAGITEQWVVQPTAHGYRFVPKWVASQTGSLFRPPDEIPKIVLMSAILTHRSADYLGVPSSDQRAWIEMDSYFPPENTPIWHIETARINYRTGSLETNLWVSRIDQIIQRRLDRKGIVFTVSYERARLLLARSRFKDIMLTHSTWDVSQVVERFKRESPPVVLVSPSVTTGYDFPQDECGFGKPQYIIIGKIPYPDTSDPVSQARHEDDKDWSSYIAMETLVQSSGRMSRSAEDLCEVLIVDNNIRWFFYRFKDFAPAWFRVRYKGTLATVPDPLV